MIIKKKKKVTETHQLVNGSTISEVVRLVGPDSFLSHFPTSMLCTSKQQLLLLWTIFIYFSVIAVTGLGV